MYYLVPRVLHSCWYPRGTLDMTLASQPIVPGTSAAKLPSWTVNNSWPAQLSRLRAAAKIKLKLADDITSDVGRITASDEHERVQRGKAVNNSLRVYRIRTTRIPATPVPPSSSRGTRGTRGWYKGVSGVAGGLSRWGNPSLWGAEIRR